MPKQRTEDISASYLQRLSFPPELMNSWVAGFIGNFRYILLLIISIVLVGWVSYTQLPKRLNPEVEISIISVVTILPGASPADVESLISEPLESHIQGVEGLDTISSTSTNNISAITLQFQSNVSRDQALADTQSLVDTFNDLPEDAQEPKVTALDFEDQPILTFAVTTSGDERSLMAFSQELQQKLEDISKVDRVLTNGFEEQEITIAVSPEKIQQFGLNPLALSAAIKQGLSSFPAGVVETGSNSFTVTLSPTISSVEDVRSVLLSLNDSTVQLSEVATVELRSKPNQGVTYLASSEQASQRAVTFYVYKTSSVSIDDAGAEVEKAVEDFFAEKGSQYNLTILENTSEAIEEQFSDLVGEFQTTIILVFVCILLFLGLRQALISSITVPLTFLSAFALMNVVGMSINFLSLFAFLLALGLLVDDTIVVISAMTAYYRSGKFTPLQTGLLVWKDTIVPIWSTTLTTIWSFVPLLLASGIIGEFIKPIPIVVTITMVSSTLLAVLVTLPIMILVLKPQIPTRVIWFTKVLGLLVSLGLLIGFASQNPLLPLVVVAFLGFLWSSALLIPVLRQRWNNKVASSPKLQKALKQAQHYTDHGIINIDGFAGWYRDVTFRMLGSRSARFKVIGAIVLYAVVGFSLLGFGLVKNEFFPKEDQKTVYLSLEMPAGTSLDVTEAQAKALLEEVRNEPDTDYVVAEVGTALNTGGFGGQQSSENSALITFRLPEAKDRERSSIELADALRERFKNYPAGKLSVVELSGGPPVGADLQLKLSGTDLDALNQYADQVAAFMQAQPGLTNVEKSIKTGTSQVKFIPDQAKLADAGLTADSIGLWMRLYASGLTLDSVKFEQLQSTDETDIVFRLGSVEPTLAGLSKVAVVNTRGESYPLITLGELKAEPNPTVIVREDGARTISISAGVSAEFNVTEKNQELTAFAETLNLPNGYTWSTGGVNEENQKSVNSIIQAMGLSALLILVTMVVQFRSFRQAFIVLIVIPLAVSSVFYVFALTGTPLSFPALIGVLSLFGIVVTNSMFIVDKINLNRQEGMSLRESVADAGASRLEPIILTKLSTVFGLLPITIADPLWRGLGGAIISGLLISSTIMLLFIPALYYTIYQGEEKKKR